jgi:hypothetical protein
MAENRTKGTKQLGAELAAPLVDEFRDFVKGRGESIRDHMELALRRHMDNPPPPLKPSAPPLPPIPLPDAGRKPPPKKPKSKK